MPKREATPPTPAPESQAPAAPTMPPLASQQAQQLLAPEVKAGNKFGLTMSSQEVMLSIGSARVLYRQDGEGAGEIVEYHATYALSPIAAQHLYGILGMLLEQYEDKFGKIPVDQAAVNKLDNYRAAAGLNSNQTAGVAAAKKPRRKFH